MQTRLSGQRQVPAHLALWIQAVLICGALVAMAAACARPSASGERYGLGQTAEVDGWQVTVHSFTLLASAENRQPAPGHIFCAVEVTVSNDSDTIRFFMPERQMTLRDASGIAYELDYQASVMAARSQNWTVPDGEISPGETAHGAASYQIPADARGLSWMFRSSLFPWSRTLVYDLGDAPQ
jgi:hypothetical protein